MSISVPPPEYQFNGLIYNPSFWINATNGLTQDVANTLYLRKTVTDSASALETFNGGIRADSINVINASGLKTMFESQTGPVTMFANMASAQTLRIGNPAVAQSNHIGNIDLQQNTINNASTSANGDIVIGNRQTGTGVLEIGYSTTRGGAINIANPASACTLNIGRPLTLGYLPSVNSGTSQLGSRGTITGTTTATLGGTNVATLRSTALTAGTWLIVGNVGMGNSGTFASISISVSGSIDNNSIVSTTTSFLFLNLTRVIDINTSQTWNLLAQTNLASTLSNVIFSATRIA
jgi:hypothetical protein